MASSSLDDIARELMDAFDFMPLIGIILDHMSKKDGAIDEKRLILTLDALKKKFQSCESLLDDLPGGELTFDEQEEQLSLLHKTIQERCERIRRYESSTGKISKEETLSCS
eukprot:Rmarinus@m.29492